MPVAFEKVSGIGFFLVTTSKGNFNLGIFGKTKVMFRKDLLERITIEEGKSGGRPCIRGMRLRVVDIMGFLAAGMSKEEILEDFPDLEENDVYAACEYVTMVMADFKPSSKKEPLQLS